jgi:hypothetical protein
MARVMYVRFTRKQTTVRATNTSAPCPKADNQTIVGYD